MTSTASPKAFLCEDHTTDKDLYPSASSTCSCLLSPNLMASSRPFRDTAHPEDDLVLWQPQCGQRAPALLPFMSPHSIWQQVGRVTCESVADKANNDAVIMVLYTQALHLATFQKHCDLLAGG